MEEGGDPTGGRRFVHIRHRIEKLLKVAAGEGEPINFTQYKKAVLQQRKKGSTVLLARDLDEIFVNNYNPEMIVAWDANIDLQPTFLYYGTITYVTDYWTKAEESDVAVLKEGVKQLSKE